jgi:hypothetical protein
MEDADLDDERERSETTASVLAHPLDRVQAVDRPMIGPDRISVNQVICRGTPYMKATRVTVYDVLGETNYRVEQPRRFGVAPCIAGGCRSMPRRSAHRPSARCQSRLSRHARDTQSRRLCPRRGRLCRPLLESDEAAVLSEPFDSLAQFSADFASRPLVPQECATRLQVPNAKQRPASDTDGRARHQELAALAAGDQLAAAGCNARRWENVVGHPSFLSYRRARHTYRS